MGTRMDEIIALWHRLMDDQEAETELSRAQQESADIAVRLDPALRGKPIESYPMEAQEAHFNWLLVKRRILASQSRLLTLLDGRIAPIGDQRYLVPIEVEGTSILTEMDAVEEF